jgi:hypothetical protein
VIAGLIVSLIFAPAVSGFQELEFQSATDGLSAAARTTLDHVFWRSGFGASVIGGPTFQGNVTAYDARSAELESLANGVLPTGAWPAFLEFASLAAPTYASGAGNDSDYATQRWNFSNGSRQTGASTLGAGAAAEAAWAGYLLRTNHYANGTQDPAGTFVGVSDADGLLGLWLVQALQDRINATIAGAAYNGSALGAFNLTDPALNDRNPSNGWQRVPNGLTVGLSTDPEPLFTGFSSSDTTGSLGAQAALILGLSEVVKLSDPAGSHASLFDGSPFDGSLYNNSLALFEAVLVNAEAYHWDATASAYAEPDAGTVSTADLAMLVRATATAEKSVTDPALKANLTVTRARSQAALASLAGPGGVWPANYTINGSSVVPDVSSATLAGQAATVEAFSAVFDSTGLKADWDWMFRAAAGLESPLFSAGSYHALAPEPENTVFAASTVAATLGALADLARTGEEPLAVYRFVGAYNILFQGPPLTLTGNQTPPVVGASFGWNATSTAYTPAANFSAAGALMAAFEFLSTGPEFYAAVGGGVSVTERAAQLLHNATASQVGAQIDSLDQQIASLQAQVAAIQAAFDALNASVSNVTDRLNLSLENETISKTRIDGLQANVTSLRTQLTNATVDRDVYKAALDNMTDNLTSLESRFANLTTNLTQAREEAARNAGLLNQSQQDLERSRTQLNTTNATLKQRIDEAAWAQSIVGAAVAVAGVAGVVVGLFITRFVRPPKAAPQAQDDKKKRDGDKDKDDESDDK